MQSPPPAFDWVWPDQPTSGSQPPSGDHLLRLVAVEERPHWGGRIVWTFEYTSVSGPRLTIFTRISTDATSNSTGLVTALNGGEYPGGAVDPDALIGRLVRAITTPKASDPSRLTFLKVRPADPTHTYRFIWQGKPQKKRPKENR